MAKLANVSRTKTARAKDEKKRKIENYTHPKKQRINNPPVGLVTAETDRDGGKKPYAYDPHLDPSLQWSSKAERTSFEVPIVSLHVHERIDPRSIIEAVRRKNGEDFVQGSLFSKLEENPPLREAVDFYKHKHNWSNRLIAGDSLLIMNSLLEKEGMAGKIQMVYLDPPYGIEYKSNFQPFITSRDVKEGNDEDLTQEPETIRAFRDTWELHIHSYLAYMRDRLLLVRDLLSDTGSIFVQINDENLSLVHLAMSEIFGAANFVVHIPVKKKGSQKSGLLDPVNDYLIWFAKDKNRVGESYKQLYEPAPLDSDLVETFRYVELPDGEEITLTQLEKREKQPKRFYRDEPKRVFEDFPGARIFKSENLTGGKPGKTQAVKYTLKGRTFDPGITKGLGWKHSAVPEKESEPSDMDRLAAANRLFAGEGQLRFRGYTDDFGYKALSNWWDGLGGASDPIYVVQTNTEILKRCILMTTQPGDLVFDPTCGSGTTAYVAEQWGRRWITCDTSRVSLNLAKQRLMTATFDYYRLARPEEGVDSGLLYRTAPHITSTTIAKNEPPTTETLYDQPLIDGARTRVSGPFTFEAVPAAAVKSPDAADEGQDQPADESVARMGETQRQGDWRDELLKSGIRGRAGQRIQFSRVEALPGTRWLHADAETKEATPERVAVSFGPDHAPLEQRQVELALHEAETLRPKPKIVVFAAFQFDPEAAKDIDETKWPGVTLLKAQMNADLLTEDLKKKRASNDSFWLIGQPDVELQKIGEGDDKGKYRLIVNGFDYYNTRTGDIESGGADKIAMWMLDTDYDGRSLFPRQVFFIADVMKEGLKTLAENLNAEIDPALIESYLGTVSLPFGIGKHEAAAVKIVDVRGIESLRIISLK
jgi:adenine-specific DNA-methyltransferase